MDENIEEFTPLNIDALYDEVTEDLLSDMAKGLELGKKHIALAQEHIREHGLDNDDPFWEQLGGWAVLELGPGLPTAYYHTIRGMFQTKLLEANPLMKAAFEFDYATRTVEKAQEMVGPNGIVITPERLGGPDGERLIDEIAADHGHETREDECEFVASLRATREHLLTQHPDKYGDPDSSN